MTWQKGQSGNPAGRPKGARNLLSESVLKELISHWEENGLDAIDRTCKEQPAAYLRAVLSLVTKRLDSVDSRSLVHLVVPRGFLEELLLRKQPMWQGR